ncbi:MAG: glycosyltransferase family 4 protein [Actinomycetia bacterium]|nr:glycosyltransferase family 4 protein [Actinomycetes bacterium]
MTGALHSALQLLGPSTGGIRGHVAQLSRGLADRGVSAPVVGPAGVMEGLGGQAGVVAVPESLDPRGLVAARRQLRQWRGGTQLVHAHGLKAAWTALAGRPSRPLVVTVHNIVLDESAGRSAAVQRSLERQVLARADRVIALTSQMAEQLSQFVPAKRIRVALPASPPPVVRQDRSAVRAGLGIDDATALVVCVARLHPQKDLPTLLRAWQSVHRTHPEAVLLVVGDGPLRSELDALHDSLGLGDSARLVGARPHAVDEIAAADVAVMTSIWEGAALVLAETTQLGVPMVSTPTGLAPEVLDGTVGGTIVPFGDDAAVAEALCRMLDDPEASAAMGALGRDRARQVFEPARAVEEIMATYLELVE